MWMEKMKMRWVSVLSIGLLSLSFPLGVSAEQTAPTKTDPSVIPDAISLQKATLKGPTAAESQVTAGKILINAIANQGTPIKTPAPIIVIAPTPVKTPPSAPKTSPTTAPAEEQNASLTQEDEIARLVGNLNSDVFATRQEAAQALQAALAQCQNDSAVITFLTRLGIAISQTPSTLELNRRLENLVRGLDLMIGLRLTTDPGTPQPVLTVLARYSDGTVRALATLHPNMPAGGPAEEAARSDARLVLQGIAGDPETSSVKLDAIARAPWAGYSAQLAVARNPNTWPETLDFLARVQNINVLLEIAGNPSTREDTLDFIARMPGLNGFFLREALFIQIARNPRTRQDTLDFLARVPGQYVSVLYLVARRDARGDTLDFLARMPGQDVDVLHAVACNPRTLLVTLRLLAKNANTEVAAAARDNPNFRP